MSAENPSIQTAEQELFESTRAFEKGLDHLKDKIDENFQLASEIVRVWKDPMLLAATAFGIGLLIGKSLPIKTLSDR